MKSNLLNIEVLENEFDRNVIDSVFNQIWKEKNITLLESFFTKLNVELRNEYVLLAYLKGALSEERIKEMMEQDKNLNPYHACRFAESNDENICILEVCIGKKHLKLLHFLLEAKKIELNKAYPFGLTPLMQAVWLNRLDVVNFLLSQPHLDINARSTKFQNTALQYCFVYYNKDNLPKAAFSSKRDLVSETEILPILEALLAAPGINLNLYTTEECSAFGQSLRCGHITSALRLFNTGKIDIDRKEATTKTALQDAASEPACSAMLIPLWNSSNNKEQLDSDGKSLLYLACESGSYEVCFFLLTRSEFLEHFDKINDNTKRSPKMVLAENSNIQPSQIKYLENHHKLLMQDEASREMSKTFSLQVLCVSQVFHAIQKKQYEVACYLLKYIALPADNEIKKGMTEVDLPFCVQNLLEQYTDAAQPVLEALINIEGFTITYNGLAPQEIIEHFLNNNDAASQKEDIKKIKGLLASPKFKSLITSPARLFHAALANGNQLKIFLIFNAFPLNLNEPWDTTATEGKKETGLTYALQKNELRNMLSKMASTWIATASEENKIIFKPILEQLNADSEKQIDCPKQQNDKSIVNEKNQDFPLYQYCVNAENIEEEKILELLNQGDNSKLLNRYPEDSKAIAYWIVEKGTPALVEILAEKGLYLNPQPPNVFASEMALGSPLMMALARGDSKMIAALLKNGALYKVSEYLSMYVKNPPPSLIYYAINLILPTKLPTWYIGKQDSERFAEDIHEILTLFAKYETKETIDILLLTIQKYVLYPRVNSCDEALLLNNTIIEMIEKDNLPVNAALTVKMPDYREKRNTVDKNIQARYDQKLIKQIAHILTLLNPSTMTDTAMTVLNHHLLRAGGKTNYLAALLEYQAMNSSINNGEFVVHAILSEYKFDELDEHNKKQLKSILFSMPVLKFLVIIKHHGLMSVLEKDILVTALQRPPVDMIIEFILHPELQKKLIERISDGIKKSFNADQLARLFDTGNFHFVSKFAMHYIVTQGALLRENIFAELFNSLKDQGKWEALVSLKQVTPNEESQKRIDYMESILGKVKRCVKAIVSQDINYAVQIVPTLTEAEKKQVTKQCNENLVTIQTVMQWDKKQRETLFPVFFTENNAAKWIEQLILYKDNIDLVDNIYDKVKVSDETIYIKIGVFFLQNDFNKVARFFEKREFFNIIKDDFLDKELILSFLLWYVQNKKKSLINTIVRDVVLARQLILLCQNNTSKYAPLLDAFSENLQSQDTKEANELQSLFYKESDLGSLFKVIPKTAKSIAAFNKAIKSRTIETISQDEKKRVFAVVASNEAWFSLVKKENHVSLLIALIPSLLEIKGEYLNAFFEEQSVNELEKWYKLFPQDFTEALKRYCIVKNAEKVMVKLVDEALTTNAFRPLILAQWELFSQVDEKIMLRFFLSLTQAECEMLQEIISSNLFAKFIVEFTKTEESIVKWINSPLFIVTKTQAINVNRATKRYFLYKKIAEIKGISSLSEAEQKELKEGILSKNDSSALLKYFPEMIDIKYLEENGFDATLSALIKEIEQCNTISLNVEVEIALASYVLNRLKKYPAKVVERVAQIFYKQSLYRLKRITQLLDEIDMQRKECLHCIQIMDDQTLGWKDAVAKFRTSLEATPFRYSLPSKLAIFPHSGSTYQQNVEKHKQRIKDFLEIVEEYDISKAFLKRYHTNLAVLQNKFQFNENDSVIQEISNLSYYQSVREYESIWRQFIYWISYQGNEYQNFRDLELSSIDGYPDFEMSPNVHNTKAILTVLRKETANLGTVYFGGSTQEEMRVKHSDFIKICDLDTSAIFIYNGDMNAFSIRAFNIVEKIKEMLLLEVSKQVQNLDENDQPYLNIKFDKAGMQDVAFNTQCSELINSISCKVDYGVDENQFGTIKNIPTLPGQDHPFVAMMKGVFYLNTQHYTFLSAPTTQPEKLLIFNVLKSWIRNGFNNIVLCEANRTEILLPILNSNDNASTLLEFCNNYMKERFDFFQNDEKLYDKLFLIIESVCGKNEDQKTLIPLHEWMRAAYNNALKRASEQQGTHRKFVSQTDAKLPVNNQRLGDAIKKDGFKR
jgi:ankyrin repeat protein